MNWGITKKWVMTMSKVTRVITIETIHIISFVTVKFKKKFLLKFNMFCMFWIVLMMSKIIFKKWKNIFDMYFGTKNYLKSNRNHTAKLVLCPLLLASIPLLPYLEPLALPFSYLESYTPRILVSDIKASFIGFSTWSQSSSSSFIKPFSYYFF